MSMSDKQANEVSGAIFLIGLGCLFYFGFWPGIMFVCGAVAVSQGLAAGRGWYAFQGAGWLFFVGIWAFFHFSLPMLFIMIGVSMLIGALSKPPFLSKPKVDNYLD